MKNSGDYRKKKKSTPMKRFLLLMLGKLHLAKFHSLQTYIMKKPENFLGFVNGSTRKRGGGRGAGKEPTVGTGGILTFTFCLNTINFGNS